MEEKMVKEFRVGVLMSSLRYFRWWGELAKRYVPIFGPLIPTALSSWLLMTPSRNHYPSLHRGLYTLHYLSFEFSVSWLGTRVVVSPNERSQLDEGDQLTGHLFSFNPNHLIHLCIFFNYIDATEQKVRHLPARQMFVLWCILVPLLLHAHISVVACLYLFCCILSTSWCVACFLCAGTLWLDLASDNLFNPMATPILLLWLDFKGISCYRKSYRSSCSCFSLWNF